MAISAQDLRIGNWVTDLKGLPIQVESINYGGINLMGGYNDEYGAGIDPLYKFEELLPIPITDEILLKAGFEWNDDKDFLKLIFGSYTFVADDSDKFNRVSCCRKNGKYSVPFLSVIYLHELQNIFHAIFKRPLTINL